MDGSLVKILFSLLFFLLGFFLWRFRVVRFACFFLSYCCVGVDVFISALRHIFKGKIFDENFLMVIATLGAFLIGEYPEGVAVMLFYQIGEYLSDLAIEHSKDRITSLMDLRLDYAHLLVDGQIRQVNPSTVLIGSLIVVKPGERVPIDGIVIEGNGFIDTVMLTGESLPRSVSKDDLILSGSLVLHSALTIQTTNLMSESTVSKILDLIENSSHKKANTEKFLTKFARIYTPIIVFSAFLLCLIPVVFFQLPFQDWFYRSLVFLVISCPCALVLSIPLGFFCGIGSASRKGILFKGSNSLEAFSKLDTIVFDKTGTLTKGVFQVVEICPESSFRKNEILKYAAYAESYSNHPIARSILDAYGKRIKSSLIQEQFEFAGYGVKTIYQGKEILVGNRKLFEKYHLVIPDISKFGTIVYLAVDRIYAGYFVISDVLKEDTKQAILQLRQLGMQRFVVLSGDNAAIVKQVCDDIGIVEYYADLLPQDKVQKMEEILSRQKGSHTVAFVGDGMNDAPVLMLADIGISMGGIGSDVAIEASDVVLMNDKISSILSAIQISTYTKKIIWQNIIFSLFIKLSVLVLGAFGIASIWLAVFSDVGVTLLAVLNALRIFKNSKI